MTISVIDYDKVIKDMRFDAEFYHPDKLQSYQVLNHYETTINDHFRQIRNMKRISKKNTVEVIDLENIVGNLIFNVKNIKGFEIGSSKLIIKKNDVVISRLRSYLKKAAINYNYSELFGSSEFIVFRKKSNSKINSEVLMCFLLTDPVQKIIKWSQEGTNHPRFPREILNDIKIPILPESVQSRIEKNIKKSDDLWMSAKNKNKKAESIVMRELELDKLQTNDQNVSIITHNDFMSGLRFDAQFYSSIFLQSLFRKKFDTLPLEKICEKLETGLTPSKNSYRDKGYPILKMGCLKNFMINWSKIEFANYNYYKRAKKYSIKEKDIFLTSSAHAIDHIGKKVDIASEIPEEYQNKLVFVGELMRFRVKQELLNPYYLLTFLRTKIGYKILQSHIRGQTAHIYPRDIKEINIPIIPIKKQDDIERLLKESYKMTISSNNLIQESVRSVENYIFNY